MDGATPRFVYACHIWRWVQTDVFTQQFCHITSATKPTIDEPALLILGGLCCDTKNPDAIESRRENNIFLLCLPPHKSHAMETV
jgi:hypothetical protein